MGKCLLFLFCLFFITPLISINKACVVVFSVTDQLEKIHMLNQMGEINSFIKLILKLPVLQCHQGRHGFDCATVRIRTLKNVQQEQFYFRLTIYFFFFIVFTGAENCLDSFAEKILMGNIWGSSF